jgi:protein transport protein SEC61 subunit gamma-like protein
LAQNSFDLDNLNPDISKNLKAYLRILKLTKKPSREEFLMIARVAGAGILVVGFVGFVIYLLLTEMPTWMVT